MKRLVELLRGYARLTFTGSSVERFLNLCTHAGIGFSDVCIGGPGQVSADVRLSDIWALHPYLRKTRTHVAVEKKRGAAFFLFHYRARILFPIALFLSIFLFTYSLSFVWRIEIEGNSAVTTEQLMRYLQERQISFGTRCSAIDCEALELSLREDFDGIIWASATVEGTELVLLIKERLPEEEPTQEKAAAGSRKIVSGKDARIDSIMTRRGTPLVAAGDEVTAGEDLVLGHQEILDDAGEVSQIYDETADADVIGRVIYSYSDPIDGLETADVCTADFLSGLYFEAGERRYEFTIPDIRRRPQKYRLTEFHTLSLGGKLPLPLGIGVSTCYEITRKTTPRDKDAALALAGEHLERYLKQLKENGAVILSKDIRLQKNGEDYLAEGTITVLEDIGVSVAE